MSARIYATVPKLWPGSTMVCIATGPSLTQAQVDAVRDKARVIVVNDAYRLAPWADVLYAADAKWWKWHKNVPGFAGRKYSIDPTQIVGIDTLRNSGETGLCLGPHGLRTGHNSGYQAINLAVHLGAKRIILLGYDMQGARNKQHFFGKHPDGSQPPFAACLKDFATLVGPLAAAGVEIVNCTPGSAIRCFRVARLEDVVLDCAA